MRKALKVMSFVLMVFGVVYMAVGIVAVAGNQAIQSASETLAPASDTSSVGVYAVSFGILAIAAGVLDLLTGLLGWRGFCGAKKLLTAAIVLVLISVLLTVLSMFSRPFQWTSLGALVLPVLFLIPAFSVRKAED